MRQKKLMALSLIPILFIHFYSWLTRVPLLRPENLSSLRLLDNTKEEEEVVSHFHLENLEKTTVDKSWYAYMEYLRYGFTRFCFVFIRRSEIYVFIGKF